MLSILIPTYNQNITKLVCELHKQALEQFIDFEIIVLEDGSSKFVKENDSIKNLTNYKHIIRTENSGRSICRNILADLSAYNHLLFIDCDAEVSNNFYIKKYTAFCNEDIIVIGGTAYDAEEKNPDFSLRLQYGRLREARTAIERNKNNFSTFNFLISKKIFNLVRFDETIRGYGHEDMLFGHQLHELGFEFTQIDNPLIHKGLDNNHNFIKKTEEATRNLFLLYLTGNYPFLSKESTLLKHFLFLKKIHVIYILAKIYLLIYKTLYKKLCKKSPSLLLYDFYKLAYMCYYATKK